MNKPLDGPTPIVGADKIDWRPAIERARKYADSAPVRCRAAVEAAFQQGYGMGRFDGARNLERTALTSRLLASRHVCDELKADLAALQSRLEAAKLDSEDGWRAYYELRSAVAAERYPGLTNVVRAGSAQEQKRD